MIDKSKSNSDELWRRDNARWRDPAATASLWSEAGKVEASALRGKFSGDWWEIIRERKITLIAAREYEHFLTAFSYAKDKTQVSYFSLPHPSGLAFDRTNSTLYAASTRNPNQIFVFRPVSSLHGRLDAESADISGNPLLPVKSYFFPGCLYLHDLAMVGGELFGNSVGQNAVVRFDGNGGYEYAWYPECIETASGPVFGRNHLQLNSIAAGPTIEESFFSASTDKMTARRPGHRNFAVDKRGVIFSGKTREAIARGLTRPHSARLHSGKIWVDNSGYGELGFIEDGKFHSIIKLPGWTRGLNFFEDIAFVGVSRVIPRFRMYAPGLETDKSVCGIFAVDTKSGDIMGSVVWPNGNQIFAVEWMDNQITQGFPFLAGAKRAKGGERALFYSFKK